jgi:hypothetical protein
MKLRIERAGNRMNNIITEYLNVEDLREWEEAGKHVMFAKSALQPVNDADALADKVYSLLDQAQYLIDARVYALEDKEEREEARGEAYQQLSQIMDAWVRETA